MLNTIKASLAKEVPPGFFEDFIHRLTEIYASGYKFLHSIESGLYRPQARDLLPHFRRAKADAALMDIAKQYSLQADDRRNSNETWGGNTNHVEVITKSFIFTAHAVSGPSEMVRPAKHRTKKAALNYPLLFPPHLFPDIYPQLKETPIYVQILHGPVVSDLSKVDFISLGFPSPDEPVYATPTIDLVRFCDISLYPVVEEEPVEDKAKPKRRKDVEIKEN